MYIAKFQDPQVTGWTWTVVAPSYTGFSVIGEMFWDAWLEYHRTERCTPLEDSEYPAKQDLFKHITVQMINGDSPTMLRDDGQIFNDGRWMPDREFPNILTLDQLEVI